MQEVVSHLPVAPCANPELGYFNQQNQSGAIARINGYPYVLTNNILGEKSQRESELPAHLAFLEESGISFQDRWVDNDRSNEKYVIATVQRGINEGWIVEQNREVFMCGCGKTEFLNTPENLHEGQDRTTYTVCNGEVTCKLCGDEAVMRDRDVLVMNLPEREIPYVDIYPNYARLEIEELLKFFKGKEYLLSRNTPKPFSINIEEKKYWIDADMGWLPFIHNLQENNQYRVDVLLTGSRTLKQVALALLVNGRLKANLPSMIISTPRIDIDFGKRPHRNAAEFLEQSGGDVTKVFLAQALGADDKSLILQSSGAYWVAKSLEKYSREVLLPEKMPDLKQFINPRNKAVLDVLLKKLRGGKTEQLTNYEKALMWVFTSAK